MPGRLDEGGLSGWVGFAGIVLWGTVPGAAVPGKAAAPDGLESAPVKLAGGAAHPLAGGE